MTFSNTFRNLFVVVLLVVVTIEAAAQTKEEIEARIKASADSVETIVKSLTDFEKKIDWGVLNRVNKMSAENAASWRGTTEMQNRYSTKQTPVNIEGQIYLNVQLLLSSTQADVRTVEQQINLVGGSVKRISIPDRSFPIEIYCWIPYEAVKVIAQLNKVGNISSVGYPVTRTGDVTSLGDSQLRADFARDHFYASGNGVKIGVISDGVTNWQSITNQNLPASIQVLDPGLGNEGTAMLEIVYDLAPSATFAFAGGITGPNDMVGTINDLAVNGCKIIVDDLGFYDIPFFEIDNISYAVENFVANNSKTYISAAGNDGESMWTGEMWADQDRWHIFHYSAPYSYNQNKFTLTGYQTVKIILQWVNKWGYSNDNYDLYVFGVDGHQYTESVNIQDGEGKNPFEIVYDSRGESQGKR